MDHHDGQGEERPLREAKKAIFVSEYMRINARRVSGNAFARSICIPNVFPGSWTGHGNDMAEVERAERKARGLDPSKLHVVYEGGLSDAPGSHRYFYEVFRQIASLRGVRLHLYCPWAKGKYLEIPGAIYHKRVDWEALPMEMALYDVNFAAFCWPSENMENTQSSIGGKLSIALAVGLPSLVEARMREAVRVGGTLVHAAPWDELEGASEAMLGGHLVATATMRGGVAGCAVRLEDYADELEGMLT